MRKLLLFTMFLCTVFTSRAQVLINLQLPQVGLQVKSQLWNMSLINTGTEILNLKLDMTLTDVYSGQVFFSGTSRVFILPAGTKQVQINDLVPIQYNILNNLYNIDQTPNGFLPIGVFTVCYSVLKYTAESFDKISEECETIEVEAASPPFLAIPDNLSAIDQQRPLFTWLPPSPAYLFNNLNYGFKLVEVNSNQQPSDAIQNNFPLLDQNYLPTNFLQYPASLPALDTSRLYAWQVRAMGNMNSGGSNSEIFTFRLSKDIDSVKSQAHGYVKLKSVSEPSTTYCTGTLLYEYVNTYNNPSIQLELTDLTTKSNNKITLLQQLQYVTYGQNFLKLDCSAISLINNHIYLLLVSGIKGEKQAVKFIYNKAD